MIVNENNESFFPQEGDTFHKNKKKRWVVLASLVLVGILLIVLGNCPFNLFPNYMTASEDGKRSYYNMDLKLIYSN